MPTTSRRGRPPKIEPQMSIRAASARHAALVRHGAPKEEIRKARWELDRALARRNLAEATEVLTRMNP